MQSRTNTAPSYTSPQDLTPVYDFISLENVHELLNHEIETFKARTEKSAAISSQSQQSSLHKGVLSTWHLDAEKFVQFPNPLYTTRAKDNRLWDADGNEYIDFMLGDVAQLFGHAPDTPVTRGVAEHILTTGSNTFLADADSQMAAELLRERFGLRYWHAALSASDANRFAITVARMVTERPKILMFQGCYHGTYEDFLKEQYLDGSGDTQWSAPIRPGQDADLYTAIVKFNDLDAVEEALRHRDIAVVITEPFITNLGGLIFPEPDFHKGLRELCTKYGTYLLMDETHTQTSASTGVARLWNLEPDMWVSGKCIAGGSVPCGVYGFNEELGEKLAPIIESPFLFCGNSGLGTTLSGNSLAIKALTLSLQHNYTEETYGKMSRAAQYLSDGVRKVIAKRNVPFKVDNFGARMALQFTPNECHDAMTGLRSQGFGGYHEYLTLYLYNRGISVLVQGNQYLCSPQATDKDCDKFVEVFDGFVASLVG